MDKTKRQALFDVQILQNVKRETLQALCRLTLIYPERNSRYEPKPGELALLLAGSAKICRKDGNRTVLLNRMQAGECIGLASLYSDELPDTEVTFHGGAVILVIPRYLLEDLIIDDAALSCNIIAALAQKVRFLNAKIAGYTAVRSDEKLYLHLLSLPKDSEGWVEIGESMSSLARRLGIGRASLYRAIDTLIEEETIVRQGQKYRILSFKNKEDESL